MVGMLQGINAHAAVAAVEPVFDPAATEAWAWCGVRPDDPVALASVTAMATVGGIDATFGPCIAEGPDYTPETPGQRYVSPAEYMKL
ncbi:MAG TPA: hypothetical protein VIT64_06905, partial [Ilumatobacteraceae bacterium]